MFDCCNDKACAIEALRDRQSSTLRIVLAINAVMFVVEFASGLIARFTALLSPALFVGLCLAALLLRSAYKVMRWLLAQVRALLVQPVRFHVQPCS